MNDSKQNGYQAARIGDDGGSGGGKKAVGVAVGILLDCSENAWVQRASRPRPHTHHNIGLPQSEGDGKTLTDATHYTVRCMQGYRR